METPMKLRMTKIALFTSLALGATQATAQTPYVGLMAGWDDVNAEFNTAGSESDGLSVSGPKASLLAGFEFQMPNGFIGIEANVNDSSAEYVQEAGTTALTVAKNLGYGADVLFGTNVSPTTEIFASVGYEMADYEVAVEDSVTGKATSEETFGGARAGLGIQSDLTDLVAIRFHWIRTFYSEEDISFSNNANEYQVKPSGNAFSVGVTGKF
jgi:opacity protein-like surface antigen